MAKLLDVDDAESLVFLCQKFIKEQKIRTPESVYQMDNVIENAYEFIEQVCDIVGYHDDEE